MTDRRTSEAASSFLAGRLEGVGFPELIHAISLTGKTGVLTVDGDGVCHSLYLHEGKIIFARSSDPEDRLGERLLREGVVDWSQLETAVGRLDTGKRIGTLLIEDASLTVRELVESVTGQVEAIVFRLFTRETGEYRFDEGPLPTREQITLDLRTSEFLLLGIHRVRSFERIRREVGAPSTVYGLTQSWRAGLAGARLDVGEQLLIERLEQGDESVEALCREVFLSNFEIYQTLWAFKVLGAVEQRDSRVERPGESSREGSLAREEFAQVLVELDRAGQTGTLFATRGNVARTFHIDGGNCKFATSSDPDDGLIHYLLRRGVISLRDRLEVARRLLTNRRVGTILRELGIIDADDLVEMVRQHLREIVYDTIGWDSGDYAFVPGELPTREEIVIDAGTDALVMSGLRRITSWTRVRRGAGEFATSLELTPTYLDVLDRMNAGPEEWEITTVLKLPRSPAEIFAESRLGDFRVAQILWMLRTLGAVHDAGTRVGDLLVPAQAAGETEVSESRADERDEPDTGDGESAVELRDRPATADVPEPPHERASDAARSIAVAELDTAEAAPAVPEAVIEPEPEPATQSASPGSPAEVAAPEPEREPPPGFASAVQRFNAAHRIVYRAVKAEVGAGAVNFIRSCCEGCDAADRLAEVELSSDGSWDSAGLLRVVLRDAIDDPWPEWARVIDAELNTLGGHLGPARLQKLRERLAEISGAG